MIPTDRGTPPETVHKTPVPTHVMHSNTFRRLTPGLSLLSLMFLLRIDLGLTQPRLRAGRSLGGHRRLAVYRNHTDLASNEPDRPPNLTDGRCVLPPSGIRSLRWALGRSPFPPSLDGTRPRGVHPPWDPWCLESRLLGSPVAAHAPRAATPPPHRRGA